MFFLCGLILHLQKKKKGKKVDYSGGFIFLKLKSNKFRKICMENEKKKKKTKSIFVSTCCF